MELFAVTIEIGMSTFEFKCAAPEQVTAERDGIRLAEALHGVFISVQPIYARNT